MLFTKVLSGLLLASVAAAQRPIVLLKPTCNQDDCARTVAGTNPNLIPAFASRRADCSSALSVTVTPIIYSTTTIYTGTSTAISTSVTTTTTTSTTTTTTTTINPMIQLDKRTATPSPSFTSTLGTVPAYASVCPNAAAYVSACGCFVAIGSTTVTAPASTSVVTVSAGATASSTTLLTVTTTQVSTITSTTMMLERGMISISII